VALCIILHWQGLTCYSTANIGPEDPLLLRFSSILLSWEEGTEIDKIQWKLRNEHPNIIIMKYGLCLVLSVHLTKQDYLLPVREYEEARGL